MRHWFDFFWNAFLLSGALLLLYGCDAAAEDTPPVSWTPFPEFAVPTSASSQDLSGDSAKDSFCLNSARFLEDLTIPDGSVVEPGAAIDKRWSIQNNGSCDWGPGYHLVRLGNDPLKGSDEVALYPARGGATAIWQVLLEAPIEPGDYLSRWQARSPEGSLFGDEVYLFITVKSPTPEPSPSPFPTP